MLIQRSTTRQMLAGPRVGAAFLAAMMFIPSIGEAAAQCGDWELVPTPNVGDSVTRLTAVTALSSDDAWSVGLWRNVSGVFGPLAMRWNGTTWSLTDLPDTSYLGTLPETNGVEAASNGDIWVVGKVFTGYPTDQLPLLLRWRGDTWDYVNTMTLRPQTVYPFGPRGGILYEVGALAPDDIWAVGLASGYGDGGATTVPLAAHWDGSTWTDVEVPRVANRHHELSDVVAISPNDVWAVGDYRNVAGAFRAVTYHWDGTVWSYVHNPIEDFPQSGLDDVAATGPNDVWAIGGAPDTGVMLMHWNGDEWNLVQPPPNSGGSLAAVGPNDLWVSGWNGFWHWDGNAWTEFPADVPGATYVIRNGGMEIVGDCNVWCVGFWTLEDGITSSSLAERLTASAALIDFTIVFGSHISGALQDLVESDDALLRTRSIPGFTAEEANLMELRVGAETTVEDANTLDLTLEGRLNQPGGTVRVRLRNWSNNAFVQVHQYTIGFTETVETIEGIDATNRVRVSDGRIELSLRHSVFATFSALGFDSFTDQVMIAVE